MIFDGAMIGGRVQDPHAPTRDTLYLRDLRRDPHTEKRLIEAPLEYLECALEPELLGEFEDLFEIFHTLDPEKLAISKVLAGPRPDSLPVIDAAYRFDLTLLRAIDPAKDLDRNPKMNLPEAVNLYWKCHSDLESIAVDEWTHKILRPRS
jgi:hypothetical protein